MSQAVKTTPVAVVPEAESLSRSTLHRQRMTWGWIFISPWIIGFLVFILLPMIASLVFTFLDFSLNHPDDIQFVGLKNYQNLLTDPGVSTSLRVTLFFMGISLPISIVLPILLATLLNSEHLWGKAIFRTLFYMPFIVPLVSVVAIWNGFLNTHSGWMNRLLETLGIFGPDWLNSTAWIYPSLLLMGVWGIGNAMLITLAGLQGVPTELYEAAKVDGANAFTRFRIITLPMISPVIFYNLVLTTIGLFRYFDIPYMLKGGNGNPGNSTLFYNIHFFKTMFTFQDMGYGATLAWFLFLISMIATVALFYSARYWVYYAGGDE